MTQFGFMGAGEFLESQAMGSFDVTMLSKARNPNVNYIWHITNLLCLYTNSLPKTLDMVDF